MRVRVQIEYKGNPRNQIILQYSSLREAARVLDCDRKHLAQMAKGQRQKIISPLGNIIKVEAHEQANSTVSSIREHPDQPEENLPLGSLEIGRGWRRVEQAVVKVTTAIKWVVSKFHKPNNMV
jgi:hypothetical protein